MRLPWKGHAHSFRVRAGMIYCRSYPRASAGTHELVDPSVAQLPEDHRMAKGFELIDGGSVTSPRGFLAGGVFAGLKSPGEGVLDLGILVSDRLAAVAGTFSTNRILSPSVTLSKQRITSGTAMGCCRQQRLRELFGRRTRSDRRGRDDAARGQPRRPRV